MGERVGFNSSVKTHKKATCLHFGIESYQSATKLLGSSQNPSLRSFVKSYLLGWPGLKY